MSEALWLRELEAENSKLKRLLAEAEPNKAALKQLVQGKWRRRGSGAGMQITSLVAALVNVGLAERAGVRRPLQRRDYLRP